MDYILHGYHVSEPTWFYLSFLLIVAVFFRFGRLWSLRNLDLILLLSIAPSLLLVKAQGQSSVGYVWLFVTTGLLLVRTLFDSYFTRRPRLPQNMNAAGLCFLCVAAFAFLMTKVMTEPPSESSVAELRRASQMLKGEEPEQNGAHAEAGPGSRVIHTLPLAISQAVVPKGEEGATHSATMPSQSEIVAARSMAILAHLAVILGLIALAHYHLGDVQLGLAMATLYLLLPCTAYEVGRVNHVLPAALIVWAFVAYRRVFISGCLLGLACGILFFPVFLLPLWIAFYARRGAMRFTAAIGAMAVLLVGTFLFTSADAQSFLSQTFGEINWSLLQFHEVEPAGFWHLYPGAYRIPIFVSFLAMLTALTIWPRHKDLGDLMANSAAIIIGAQFWYPQQGGMYVLWYLPILLMIVFRPALNQAVPPELRPAERKAEEAAPDRALIGSASSTGPLFR